ncbi:MAG: hypothetical protein C0615_01635 [Desulfuromonas sp.]|nr:MAG: hypothetical protein C0615_01635 [Desulfuromonas sp.]
MVFANSDIASIELAVPDGHKHLRAAIRLHDGGELVLSEATIANLLRAYVTVKTHPQKESVVLTGKLLAEDERKGGFAKWQLLE